MSETMNHPKVTVVTVCYQAAAMLKKTLLNIVAQQYEPLEYIVVDGGSDDDTLSVIRRHESAITRWVSEPDGGIYDAMNKAVAMATGEWVVFMNAGDQFAADDVLSRVFSEKADGGVLTHGHTAADVIYGDVVKGGLVKKTEPWHNAHRMIFCHQSALTRTDCLRRFSFDVRHRMSADFHFYKRLAKSGGRFVRVDFPIADFDTTGVSNARRSEGLKDNIQVIREVDGWYDQLRLLPRLLFVYALCRLRGK